MPLTRTIPVLSMDWFDGRTHVHIPLHTMVVSLVDTNSWMCYDKRHRIVQLRQCRVDVDSVYMCAACHRV